MPPEQPTNSPFSFRGTLFFLLFLLFFWPAPLLSQQVSEHPIFLKGRVIDPQGNALPGASVELSVHDPSGNAQVLGTAISGRDGLFELNAPRRGPFDVKVQAAGFRPVTKRITAGPKENLAGASSFIEIRLSQVASPTENVTVTADVDELDVLSPDPALRVFVTQDLLDANPGRPGAPVSIPGFPIETASSRSEE